jgi:hypothetical protein
MTASAQTAAIDQCSAVGNTALAAITRLWHLYAENHCDAGADQQPDDQLADSCRPARSRAEASRRGSCWMFDTPPNRNSVMLRAGMPWARATIEWASSCASTEAKNSRPDGDLILDVHVSYTRTPHL